MSSCIQGNGCASRVGSKASFYVFLGMLCISINDLFVKQFSKNYPLHEIIFIRSLIAILFTLLLVKSEGGLKILKTQQPIQHALRAVAIFLCNMIFFSAIATLPLLQPRLFLL